MYQPIHSLRKEILKRERVIFFPEKLLVLQETSSTGLMFRSEMHRGGLGLNLLQHLDRFLRVLTDGSRSVCEMLCQLPSAQKTLEKKSAHIMKQDVMGWECGVGAGLEAGKSPFNRAHFDPVTLTVKPLSSNTASPKVQIQSKWDSPV